MNSLSRKFIIFSLMASLLGAFAFHWFFMAEKMPAGDCMSINCIYSSTQIITQEPIRGLLVALMLILFVSLFSSLFWSIGKLKGIFKKIFFRDKIDIFYYRLFSWLKTLGKRDPWLELISARIFDFRQ